MAKRIREAIRGRWLSAGVQAIVLAALLLVIASFSFRFHPHSGPLTLLGYALILVAASSIALSPRWPVAAVGIALGATLISHALAGIGIADQLRDAMVRDGLPAREATRRFWCIGRNGLCTTDMAASLRDFQRPYARPSEETHGWTKDETGSYGLADLVRQVKPTMLVGTSTVAGAFTEAIVRAMAAEVERPIIFPLTNPTAQSEAVPADLIAWTDGHAVIATGSPFPPVTYAGTTYAIAQANNALVFPGLGLGTIVTRARTVSDGMLAAAASAVASHAGPVKPGAAILPEVADLRTLSAAVAGAVARAAIDEGLAGVQVTDVDGEIRRAMWQPAYRRVLAV